MAKTITPSPVDLSSLMSAAQRFQLAKLLAEVIDCGYGSLTIIVQKGEVRFFQPAPTYNAGPPPRPNQESER